jgi:hypothetical protein
MQANDIFVEGVKTMLHLSYIDKFAGNLLTVSKTSGFFTAADREIILNEENIRTVSRAEMRTELFLLYTAMVKCGDSFDRLHQIYNVYRAICELIAV